MASKKFDSISFKTRKARLSAGVSIDGRGNKGKIIQGEKPDFSWKGENLVDAFTMFMIPNLIQGNTFTQPGK